MQIKILLSDKSCRGQVPNLLLAIIVGNRIFSIAWQNDNDPITIPWSLDT